MSAFAADQLAVAGRFSVTGRDVRGEAPNQVRQGLRVSGLQAGPKKSVTDIGIQNPVLNLIRSV